MLTSKQVLAAKPGAKVYELVDGRGLALVVQTSGAKIWRLRYRNHSGERKRIKLGQFPDMSLAKARSEAAQHRGDIERGADPAAERTALRTAPTMAELVKRYQADRVPGMKATTQISEADLLRKHVLCVAATKRKPSPCTKLRLASRKVADVGKADVEKIKLLMRDTPGAANKVIGILSRLFSFAEDLGWRAQGSNPCRGVRKNPEKRIERYLTAGERQRLEAALTAAESTGLKRKGRIDAAAVGCFRLLLWTGARLGEALDLRWKHVDLEHKRLVLDDSKEKNRAKIVHLPAPAVSMLEARQRDDSKPGDLVFAASDGGRLENMQRRWQSIRDAAGLPGFRIHDCRHAWASSAVMHGVPLHVVGRALGHASPSTTNRYAHLSGDVVASAVEKIGSVIEADTRGEVAKVVPMKRRRAKGRA
jgi:integrase